MEFIQDALTYAIEAIAFIGIIGLPAHYIVMSHVCEVQSWGTPYTTPEPEVKTEAETVTEVAPSVKVVEQVVKSRKTRSKKALQPKLQPMSVGAAVVNYSATTSEQLRKECALRGIDWRHGGDYGKPMKKGQMLAALR
jgi:hypothetical protein